MRQSTFFTGKFGRFFRFTGLILSLLLMAGLWPNRAPAAEQNNAGDTSRLPLPNLALIDEQETFFPTLPEREQ